ncbi:MAG: transporter substrate-binding domain-containing protein, partial [Nitrosopumilaceae archaeon]|nr:transporter substrate-binding domain-containing protein [Nitrosopumilaceae archaeon]
ALGNYTLDRHTGDLTGVGNFIEHRMVESNDDYKWIELPDLSDTTIKLDDDERVWLGLNPTINLGYAPDWAPLEYIDDSGNLAGLSGDLAAEFARLSGSSFEPVPELKWIPSLEGVRDKAVDAVLMANASDMRRADYNMAFSEPWVVVSNDIITKGVRADITADSLGSFRVVGVAGYAINAWIVGNYPGVSFTAVGSYEEALRAVESGTADAFVDPWVVASHQAAEFGVSGLANSGSLPDDVAYKLSVGYHKDNKIFGGIVQKMLDVVTAPSTRICR